jgi:hypothetical protein
VHDPWSDGTAPGARQPTKVLPRHQVGQSVEDLYRIPAASHNAKVLFVVFCGARAGTGTSAVFIVKGAPS